MLILQIKGYRHNTSLIVIFLSRDEKTCFNYCLCICMYNAATAQVYAYTQSR